MTANYLFCDLRLQTGNCYFSVRPDLCYENWNFPENNPKCNYLCAHLQVWFGKANGIVWWLTFQVQAAYYSGTRSMESHRTGWFFKYQTDGIPSIRWLKIQNMAPPSVLSVKLPELHFWPLGHLSSGFQGKKTEKMTFKKLFFTIWKLTLFGESLLGT